MTLGRYAALAVLVVVGLEMLGVDVVSPLVGGAWDALAAAAHGIWDALTGWI